MTASRWKWVLPRLLDELTRALCSCVPTAPLTVQPGNCPCKSNYVLMKFVYFLRSLLHHGFLFLKNTHTHTHTQNQHPWILFIYFSKISFIMLDKGKPNKSLILWGSIPPSSLPHSVLYRMSIRNFLIPEFIQCLFTHIKISNLIFVEHTKCFLGEKYEKQFFIIV